MQEFDIEMFVCDPSSPAYIEQFRSAGKPAVGAINDIAPGISAVQERLKVAGDGRPRLYVYEYALQERDERREAMHEPCGFEQEIDFYVWPQSKNGQPVKEVPVKVNEHSMDAARYVCMWLAQSCDSVPFAVSRRAQPSPVDALLSGIASRHAQIEPDPDDEFEQRLQAEREAAAQRIGNFLGGNHLRRR